MIIRILIKVLGIAIFCLSGCGGQDHPSLSPEPPSPVLIPAQTITSTAAMDIFVKCDENWEKIGQTPGTVKIPECEDRYFRLTDLTIENVTAYQKELKRLGILRIFLPIETTDLKLTKCKKAGLLKSLKTLGLLNCKGLTNITLLSDIQSLEGLVLISCDELRDYSPLAQLKNLKILDLSDCRELTDISFLTSLKNLTDLRLSSCGNLGDFTPLADLKNLQYLALPGLITDQDIQWLKSKGVFTNIKSFGLCEGSQIVDFSFLSSFKYLEKLHLARCINLTDLSGLSKHKKLTCLDLSACERLTDISDISSLKELTSLYLAYCEQLDDLRPLAKLQKLKALSLPNCVTDQQLHGLKEKKVLANLNFLSLPGCRLTSVSDISDLRGLRILDLSRCRKLANISALSDLKKLETLFIERCPNIKLEEVKRLQKQLPKCKIIYSKEAESEAQKE